MPNDSLVNCDKQEVNKQTGCPKHYVWAYVLYISDQMSDVISDVSYIYLFMVFVKAIRRNPM